MSRKYTLSTDRISADAGDEHGLQHHHEHATGISHGSTMLPTISRSTTEQRRSR